jgi:hypothetical protein
MEPIFETLGENFQAHACFRTTHAAEGLQPEPTILREERLEITRDDPTGGLTPNAAGVYYLSLTEDIGGTTGGSADIDANVGATAGGFINVQKIAAFVWRIELFTITGGGAGVLTLDDLIGAGNTGSVVSVTFRRVEPA